MVNLGQALLARHATTVYKDPYWKKRQIFKMSAHFYGRARNCWSIAIRRVQRAMQYVVVGRKLRKEWYFNLWEDRITAGCKEHGNFPQAKGSRIMMDSLAKSNVLLNRQSLANLAVWEPRTFKAINAIAADKARNENVHPDLGYPVTTVKGKLP